MIRRPPRSTQSRSSAASDVYKRQPLQEDGMDLTTCEDLIREHHPLMTYVISDFQNPSGTTMSEAKRRAFAALAEQYDMLVLEDTPYRRLRYAGDDVPTIQSLIPHRTIQL